MPISGFEPHEPTLTHEQVYQCTKTVLNEKRIGTPEAMKAVEEYERNK